MAPGGSRHNGGTRLETRILPGGRGELARQLVLFLGCYGAYELIRAAAPTTGGRPFGDAIRIVDLERSLHVFVEPGLQAWVQGHAHWLMVACVFIYLNAHLLVTTLALAFVYSRRHEYYPLVRNMFLIAIALALAGYTLFPTAPPRLMPQFGFTDSVLQTTGLGTNGGASGVLVNPYAAIPSMHVCFALMLGVALFRTTRHRVARVLWLAYPAVISFVVVVTGNHYLTDVVLGGLTAAVAALIAGRLPVPSSAGERALSGARA